MAAKGRKRRDETHVPAVVVYITYLLCWGAGAYLVATAGEWKQLAVALFFIIWPMSGTSPGEILRAWRGE